LDRGLLASNEQSDFQNGNSGTSARYLVCSVSCSCDSLIIFLCLIAFAACFAAAGKQRSKQIISFVMIVAVGPSPDRSQPVTHRPFFVISSVEVEL